MLLLMSVCLMGMIYFGFVIFSENKEYLSGDEAYIKIRTIHRVTPHENEDQGAKIDFDALTVINDEVIGWISSEGTEVDYPVVQGEDNYFYLNHLFTGEKNKVGTIFMDYRNHDDFSDKNTILYGHNMKDGSMFASLSLYKEQEFYDTHSSMVIHAKNGSYRIDLFAGLIIDGDESIRIYFKDNEDFINYFDSLSKGSTFESNTVITDDDQIITLATCSYEFNNARYVLCGKVTPILNERKMTRSTFRIGIDD